MIMYLPRLTYVSLLCLTVSLGATTLGCGGDNDEATGAAGSGGAPGAGGGPGAGGAAPGPSTLPRLTVSGNKLQDPSGKTIVLRGSSLIDIGALYAYGGNSAAAITARLDKVAAAGLQGHVVRLPVYPKISYNGGYPACSPLPYPVGTGPSTTCTPKQPLSADDYVAKVLKPAIDYASTKDLYVIIDYHQIDDATKGTSAADATTFWTHVAPLFAGYTNVIYEPFNEPIDTSASWSAFQVVVQGWIDTIRARAPDNIILVPSPRWDQLPGTAASSPPTGTNLMYVAHIYPGNWSSAFQSQLTTALAKVPVFISEWGYVYSTTASPDVTTTNVETWGSSLQTVIDDGGASWTAWVTDNAWLPNLFTDMALTQLSPFGTQVQTWLAGTDTTDWVR
jgi:hypothetical protein